MNKFLKLNGDRSDTWLSFLVLVLFVALQLNFVFSIGVCCADDAINAVLSKNLADGLGYATTIQEKAIHFSVEKFDDRIGNGPTTILPGALLIAIFGNQYWVPGFTQVLVTTSLLVIIGYLLKRYNPKYRLFLFSLLFFFITFTLMTRHFEQWYAMLGEVPAALLIIIGTILFFQGGSKSNYFLTGLVFSLAVNAKLVAFLPVFVFTVGIFLLDLLIWHRKQVDQSFTDRPVFVPLLAGFVLPFLAMEIWKASSLGGPGYYDYWVRYTEYVFENGVAGELSQNTLVRIKDHLGTFYDRFGVPFVFLPGILSGTWFLLRNDKKLIRVYLSLVIVIVFYSLWWIGFSIGWARHFVIALLLAVFLCVLPLLELRRTKYLAVYVVLLLGCTSLTWGRMGEPLDYLQGHFYDPVQPTRDMIEAAEILRDHPREIILTQWWGSVADLEYLMDTHLNFTTYRDPVLEPGTPYWLALNREFIYQKDQTFLDFRDSCETIFESERHYIGECILPDFNITGSQ